MNGSCDVHSHSRFSANEDHRLCELVAEYGTQAWEQIAAAMPRRTRRQCRDRWNHYLMSRNGSAPWTPAEDAELLEKLGTVGPRWTRLATFLPDRTPLDVKRRWVRLFQRKKAELRLSAVRGEVPSRTSRATLADDSMTQTGPTLLFMPEISDDLFDVNSYY
jgi:hypothetical protein